MPRSLAQRHQDLIDNLFANAGITTSWSAIAEGTGATVKPLQEATEGELLWNDMDSVHALLFLIILLNHRDNTGTRAAPDTHCREGELLAWLDERNIAIPPLHRLIPEAEGRTRRIVLALTAIGTLRHMTEIDPDRADEWGDTLLGPAGLAGLWLMGKGIRTGLAHQIADESGNILTALRERFSFTMGRQPSSWSQSDDLLKHCILCNEPVPVEQKVTSGSDAHGIKVSAFSGRDGRNDHLARPKGDTHLCLVCLAELQLRHRAQQERSGRTDGSLPPLISSPVTTGLFGGVAYVRDNRSMTMGLHDLNRLEIKKGSVYQGLACQSRRLRMARLETLPTRDTELVSFLRLALQAIRRVGRPLHIFRGYPHQHPAIFYYDAMPAWLELLLEGNELRLEQIPDALQKLALYETMAECPGLGISWAKQLADPSPQTKLGAICVAWATTLDHDTSTRQHAMNMIRDRMRNAALDFLRNQGENTVNLKNNPDSPDSPGLACRAGPETLFLVGLCQQTVALLEDCLGFLDWSSFPDPGPHGSDSGTGRHA